MRNVDDLLPQRVILVRHGETGWNSAGQLQGHSNPSLNEKGKTQAREVALQLAEEEVERIISSDLARAAETAGIIARHHRLPLMMDPLLRELNFGGWEGLTLNEIQSRFPQECNEWMQDPWAVRIPGGETAEELKLRVIEAWNRIIDDLPAARTVVIVAHGGPLRVLMCHLTQTDPSRHWEFDIRLGESIMLIRSGEIYAKGENRYDRR